MILVYYPLISFILGNSFIWVFFSIIFLCYSRWEFFSKNCRCCRRDEKVSARLCSSLKAAYLLSSHQWIWWIPLKQPSLIPMERIPSFDMRIFHFMWVRSVCHHYMWHILHVISEEKQDLMIEYMRPDWSMLLLIGQARPNNNFIDFKLVWYWILREVFYSRLTKRKNQI